MNIGMRGLCILILFKLSCVICLAQDIETENEVLILTDDNFRSAIETHSFILVEFYAPWCGHCQQLAPEYEKAAKLLSEKESTIKLAKVDATKETKVAGEFDIEGYPTLKLFKNKNPTDFNGGRTANEIVAYLEKKSGPSWKIVTEPEELKDLLEQDEALLVAFLNDLEGEKAAVIKETANSFDELNFYFISDPEIMKKYYQKDGSILLMKTFDEKEVHFTDKLTKENLLKFVKTQARPLVQEFNQENADKIFNSDIVVHFLLISDKTDEGYEGRIEAMKVLAKEHRRKMIFVHLHIEEEEAPDVMEFLGVTKDDSPTYVIFEIEDSSKYLPKKEDAQDITVSTMVGFVKEYFAGNIKKFLKSATLPEDWNVSPVKVLVGSNFEEVAKDNEKDVFVKFYAPWCGHCKKIAPIWDELAEKYKDKVDLTIAKIDGVDNEVDGFEVDGFPTLVMVKKNTNEQVTYSGKRDLESMAKFIETGEQDETEEGDDENDDDYDDEAPDYPDEDYPEDGDEDEDYDSDLEKDFDIDEEDDGDTEEEHRRIEL